MDEKNNKKFDSVKFMRETRDRLSSEYNENPNKEQKDLEAIWKKYNLETKIKAEQ